MTTYPRPSSDKDVSRARNAGLVIVVVAAIAALVVSGYVIGYDRGKPDKQAAQTPTPAPSGGGSGAGEGEELFKQSCGSCHRLAAAGTTGTSGPDLDLIKPDEKSTEDQIINGGGAMPPGLLQGEQATAVAKYVAEVAGKK